MTSEGPAGDPVSAARERLEAGSPGQALALLEPLIASGRAGPYAHLLFGRALSASGRAEAAISVLRELASLSPSSDAVALALGEAFLARGTLPLAIPEFQRVLRISPDHPEAHWGLARAWTEAGEPDKAEPHLAAAEEAAGAEAMARLGARLSAMRTAQRSDPGYVRHLFDQFSIDYDRKMRAELRYAAPEILRALAQFPLMGRRDLRILDLGCGTGLAAAAFRDLASRIVGVDLSPGMIARADATGLYAALHAGDIVPFLGETAERFDLVLAADVFVYLGDLAPAFAGAARVLAERGTFLFTVECCEGTGFALGDKRRWRHSESYLRRLAVQAGFEVAGLIRCTPRSEAGQPINGLAAALQAA